MNPDQEALAAHRWAVRVNLPTDASHAASTARRALEVAGYASVTVPAEVRVALEVLEGWAAAVAETVRLDSEEQASSGMTTAAFQEWLERSG